MKIRPFKLSRISKREIAVFDGFDISVIDRIGGRRETCKTWEWIKVRQDPIDPLSEVRFDRVLGRPRPRAIVIYSLSKNNLSFFSRTAPASPEFSLLVPGERGNTTETKDYKEDLIWAKVEKADTATPGAVVKVAAKTVARAAWSKSSSLGQEARKAKKILLTTRRAAAAGATLTSKTKPPPKNDQCPHRRRGGVVFEPRDLTGGFDPR
jgi:hypothetical protein